MMFGAQHSRFWRVTALGLLLAWVALAAAGTVANESTVEELKEQIAQAKIVDRPALCLQVAERQAVAAGKSYTLGDSDQAQAALNDVVAFSELARDYSVQTRKHEKQSEIAIRKIIHKLGDIQRVVTLEDQKQVQSAIDRLQRVRDDLLVAMFPKVGKK